MILTTSYQQKFGHSTNADACTVLSPVSPGTSALDPAPRAPRFNTFVFELHAVPEAMPSDQSAMAPTAQPNAFSFKKSPTGRIIPQSSSSASSSRLTLTSDSSSSSSQSNRDEYLKRATALFVGRLPVLMYSIRAHHAIFTSAVNQTRVAADIKSTSIWSLASKFFSGDSAAAAPRHESFYVNFVQPFEDEAFGA